MSPVSTPERTGRARIEGLPSPHPLGAMLPALYQEDDFAQRFTQALDSVLAPVFLTIECVDAYLDPWLAPGDFVEWLAGWVGVALDETWPIERQRELVARAVETYRWRGTLRGLRTLVEIYTGHQAEIVESGGVRWSPTPGADPPGSPHPLLTVRLRVPDASSLDWKRLEAVVVAAKPAHIPHVIEVSQE